MLRRMQIAAWLGLCAMSAAASASAAEAPPPYTYVHHAVSTDRPAAQAAFDRGLTLVFGYAREEAEASFRLAAKLDPSLAMAWWGVALALGPDINNPPEIGRTHDAAEALDHAATLAEARATAEERAYIAALARRYSHDEHPDFDRLATGYQESMAAIVAAHPEDADAAALYAEALMDLRPWQLWDADGQPAAQTETLVSMLESHLALAPDHVGLLHFYIHAIEASPTPGRALPAARRLAQMPMEPAAAHLVHMPAHIYLRVGDWPAAVDANLHATHHALDFRHGAHPTQKLACGHCADFLRHAYTMAGDLANARAAAERADSLTQDPTGTLGVLVRFRQWDEILIRPAPATPAAGAANDGPDPQFAKGYWHYARGMALAATGRLAAADGELVALKAEAGALPALRAVPPGSLNIEHGLEDLFRRGEHAVLALATQVLEAQLAQKRQGPGAALAAWRRAVELDDHLPYSEPPLWYAPVRESLGAALLAAGRNAEAEATFSEDLRRNPNNPRSLFGLTAALRALGRRTEAAATQTQYEAAARIADRPLSLEDL